MAESAALYTALEQAIGSEPAVTLMEQQPDRTRFATKDDLSDLKDSLRADFGARFDQIDMKMHEFVRTFIITQVTSIFGAVGLFLGIQQLL